MGVMEGVEARHSSKSAQHFTPPRIVEPARTVLGAIHFDPFSCELANRFVKAFIYYDGKTPETDGWSRPWHGRVLCNPPGGHVDASGRTVIKASKQHASCKETGDCGLPPGHEHDGCESAQKRAWFRLVAEYEAGRVECAVFVCFSVELLQTTLVNPLGAVPLDFPVCFPRERIAYYTDCLPKEPTKKQREEFARLGACEGTSPPHSSCLVCLPPKGLERQGVELFRRSFEPIGRVVQAVGALA
jgi:hypothetical protein